MAVDGLTFDRPGILDATIDELIEQGIAGLNRTIEALAAVTVHEFSAVLEQVSHEEGTKTPATRGETPPARISGDLAGSTAVETLEYAGGLIINVHLTEFYAGFLQRGWHPIGNAKRRTRKQARAIRSAAGGVGLVRYPYVGVVWERVNAAVDSTVSSFVVIR